MEKKALTELLTCIEKIGGIVRTMEISNSNLYSVLKIEIQLHEERYN